MLGVLARMLETFDDADEGIRDSVARENFHQHVPVDCVKSFGLDQHEGIRDSVARENFHQHVPGPG